MYCIFTADSKLIHPIEWNKLGNDVNNVSSHQYASVNDYKDPRYLVNNSELIITNVNSIDEGKYYCVAKTETGMNYGEIELLHTRDFDENFPSYLIANLQTLANFSKPTLEPGPLSSTLSNVVSHFA